MNCWYYLAIRHAVISTNPSPFDVSHLRMHSHIPGGHYRLPTAYRSTVPVPVSGTASQSPNVAACAADNTSSDVIVLISFANNRLILCLWTLCFLLPV